MRRRLCPASSRGKPAFASTRRSPLVHLSRRRFTIRDTRCYVRLHEPRHAPRTLLPHVVSALHLSVLSGRLSRPTQPVPAPRGAPTPLLDPVQPVPPPRTPSDLCAPTASTR